MIERLEQFDLGGSSLARSASGTPRKPLVHRLSEVGFWEGDTRGRYLRFIDLILVWLSAGVANAIAYYLARVAGARELTIPSLVEHLGLLFLFSVLVVLFANIHELYTHIWQRTFREELEYLGESVSSSALVLIVSLYLGGAKVSSVLAVIPMILFSWLALAAWRRFLHAQSIPGLFEKRNVLIIGGGRTAKQLQQHLNQHPELGYVVKGFLDRREQRRPQSQDQGGPSPEFLGKVQDLAAVVRAHFIDEVFVCVPDDRRLVMEIAEHAVGTGVHLRVIPDLYDQAAIKHSVEYVGQFPTMTLQRCSVPTAQLMLKRIVDIAVSAALLFLLSPLLLIIALIVRLDSKGPFLYRSIRVGRKGQTFTCYKFRTMVADAEIVKSSIAHLNERRGILFKIANDPRITGVGGFLRKYSLDELPQLVNVLLGNMSLVGPRPPLPGEYEQYALDHLRRLDVTPGITGLWQVTARQDPSFQSYVELDREYVDHWSLWMDCRILWKTFGIVVAGTGQ